MKQPIFQLVQNRYQERQIDGWKECWYYEMTPFLPPIYIPDGGCELLWDTREKRLYFLHGDMIGGLFELQRAEFGSVYPLPQGGKLLGIHIDSGYQASYNIEELECWLKKLGGYDFFAERAAFCSRSLDKVLKRSSTVFLADCVLKQIRDAQGRVVVDNLAAEYHYTSRQLERLFRKMYGCTPKRMCQFIRLLSAVEMMRLSPDLSFSGIAQQLGYSDTSHFQREFKRFMGVTPGKLREEYILKPIGEGSSGDG
ncbi:MAG: helix-turn-helix domain-containing protein [Lachnospiraceae bacterium]|nr:helix-turn-helix domain-containing protein [Lachnospiraceae bacterium]MDE6626204.1 helix-turn-helix domain-containing protein [Lachnospiraceae bacterium]